jgi:hypothetical protein
VGHEKAREGKIEITPSMIAAGVRAYDIWDMADDPELVVISIFRAMAVARATDLSPRTDCLPGQNKSAE